MNEKVNCMTCIHYYVTWDASFPKGCKLFEFKTQKLPSELVRESTGAACKNHVEKKKEVLNALRVIHRVWCEFNKKQGCILHDFD